MVSYSESVILFMKIYSSTLIIHESYSEAVNSSKSEH